MNPRRTKENLSPHVQQAFFPYFKSLKAVHGDNLVSVFLYGSATGTDFVPGVSDINSGLVFRKLDFPALQKSLPVVSEGLKKKIPAPLFLTKESIANALDVFPLEFRDMQENHVIIDGEDVISVLEIKDEHVRLFCEQQIKGRLIRVRQGYLETGLSPQRVSLLLQEALTTLMPVFRNLLRLKGEPLPSSKPEILERLCGVFQLKRDVFLKIHKHKSGEAKIPPDEMAVDLDQFLIELGKLAEQVNVL